MKTVRIHEHGSPEVLRHEDAERPEPGAGQILIRVRAAGVNPADHKHRSGMFKDFVPYVFPLTLGYDVAGTVEALGNGVDGPPLGTGVFAMLDPMIAGGYAQYVLTDAASVAEIPSCMDFETAAAMPCPALTGTQMVEEYLKPATGNLVLVTGATGMVGRFAVRALLAASARVVAAVRPAYAEDARKAGAHVVVPLDESPWTGEPFDGVIDTVGGPGATVLAAATQQGGRILTVATDPLDISKLPNPPEFVSVHPDGARLSQLGQDVLSGQVSVPIKARFPLAEAAKAHEAVEAGGLSGKIVLTVG